MHTQTNESAADDRLANVAVQLNELLERGDISREAFAVYAGMADVARRRSWTATVTCTRRQGRPAGARFWGQVRGFPGRLRVLRGKRAAGGETAKLQGKRATKHLSRIT